MKDPVWTSQGVSKSGEEPGAFALDIGPSPLERARAKTLTFSNCSTSSELSVEPVEVTGRGFALSYWPGQPVARVPAGERIDIVVEAQATSEQTFTGQAVFKTDDPALPLIVVDLSARGVSVPCPTAIAEARVRGEQGPGRTSIVTNAMTTIDLNGSASSASIGPIKEYQWLSYHVQSASRNRFEGQGDQATESLLLDAPGDYIVTLDVTDRFRLRSCEPALIAIEALPWSDLRVDLTWTTPGDPDRSGAVHTDLDLHYKRSPGEWDEAPDDIFWRNPTAD